MRLTIIGVLKIYNSYKIYKTYKIYKSSFVALFRKHFVG